MAFTEEEIREFKSEAEELLDLAEESLLSLDRGEAFSSHYDSIFRAFHSIKGAAGMMEMLDLQGHMHKLENTLTEQKGKTVLSKPLIDLFLRGSDAARSLLHGNAVTFDYAVHADATKSTESVSESHATLKVSAGKVLIIDDEAEILALFGEILREFNFEVSLLSKPEEVLQVMKTFEPDVVLTDIAMPKMNGSEVLAVISKAHPEVPVIFISGNVTKQILMDAITKGVYGVIEKPCDAVRMAEVCINAAKKHKTLKLLNSSINLLLYQFSDLTEYLETQGKNDISAVLKTEIATLLEQRRLLRAGRP